MVNLEPLAKKVLAKEAPYPPMGILDIFKRKEKVPPKEIGNTVPICPYCNKPLPKMPAKKKKCPECGNFIFVRTRPSDNEKVLVTEAQTEAIKEQWAIANGTHDEYLKDKERFAEAKDRLARQFGCSPSDNDVQWRLLSEEQLDHAKKAQWGLYTSNVIQMAEILRKEDRLKPALNTYLEVFYIELHGPTNNGNVAGFPAFNHEFELIAPGVINRIVSLIDKTKASYSEVRNMLDEISEKRCSFITRRIPVSTAYDKLKAAFAERERVMAEIGER